MEQISNPISGCFVETQMPETGEEDSDEDGDDDIPWLGYNEVSQVQKGKSLVKSRRPKQVVGCLIDIYTRKGKNFRGNLHFTGQWWRVIVLRTKKAKDKKYYPSDMHALTYRLRDDERCYTDNVVHLLLTKIGRDLADDKPDKAGKSDKSAKPDKSGKNTSVEDQPAEGSSHSSVDKLSVYLKGKERFYSYLKDYDQYESLDIHNLEERINEFHDSFIAEQDDEAAEHNQTLMKNEDYQLAKHFQLIVLGTFEFRCIKLAQTYPDLIRYLPQIFPNQFLGLVKIPDNQHKNLLSAIEDNPGHLAFKPIVAKECGVLGVETSSDALERSGLMTKVPQVQKEAILIYEYIKRKTKEEGHTCVKFDSIMDYFGSQIGLIEEAHQFLEKNKVTKTRMEGGYRMVYLMSLWQAEKKIATSISALFHLQEGQPWKLDVDWEGENFESIRKDGDQWRAAQLIASQPVVAISGKGGCGKTHVVTQVITAARAASKVSETEMNKAEEEMSNTTKDDCDLSEDSDMFDYREMEQQRCPPSVNLLLTAPTGKAANLLGKRADSPSYTLHQVIFSYRNYDPTIGWKHKDVNTLVVDECSLVAVTTFAFLIEVLIQEAKLRRIVLLGDVRQLPSIEPGNFLDDLFQSLSRVGCGVELRNNHRAESQIVVDNATSISKRNYPLFVPEKFMLLKVPEGNPAETGDDLVNDDTEQEVIKILNRPALQDDSRSQFISFTRKICERINEACCRKYSHHNTRTPDNRWDFQINDKICCTKNGYVQTYEEEHGIMLKKKKKAAAANSSALEKSGCDGTKIGLQQDDTDPSIAGVLDISEEGEDAWKQSGTDKQKNESERIRLCNGEIFFIQDNKVIVNERNDYHEYLYLSERDPDSPEAGFWVDRKELKRECRIRHAWARTIHTFQGSETDHIVYIVGKQNRHQNWQHVYTAITRGRKSVFIIGQESLLKQVIKRPETKRNTSLRKHLIALLQKNPKFMSSQSVLQQSRLNMTILPPEPSNLNITQGITGILASLAEEHDGIDPDAGSSDAEHSGTEKTKSADKLEKSVNESEFDSLLSRNNLLNNQNSLKKSKLKLKKKSEYRYKETDITNTTLCFTDCRSPVQSVLSKGKGNFSSANTSLGNNFESLKDDDDDDFVIESYDSPASVTEPKSNESIWSEADESQYVSFVDATMCSMKIGSSKSNKTDESSTSACVDTFDIRKQSLKSNEIVNSSLETPPFTRIKQCPKVDLFRASLTGSALKKLGHTSPDQRNESTASQWSDVPDEQYLSLNLEDIESMENDFDQKVDKDKISLTNGLLNISDFEDIDDRAMNNKGTNKLDKVNGPVMKTPEKLVKDTPPLPSVPDTPPDQYSRKRRSFDTYEEMVTSPSRQRIEKKDISVSPLKRSLAQLNFK